MQLFTQNGICVIKPADRLLQKREQFCHGNRWFVTETIPSRKRKFFHRNGSSATETAVLLRNTLCNGNGSCVTETEEAVTEMGLSVIQQM